MSEEGSVEMRRRDVGVEKEMLEQTGVCFGEQDRVGLEMHVKKCEFDLSLKSMKRGKMPGMDGLAVEFDNVFWEVIGGSVHEVCVKVLQDGKLSKSISEGLIELLYKKGEKKDLMNWRPISLVNVDYKLIAKVIADHLHGAVDRVVEEEQICAVPGRTIAESLSVLRDVLWYCKERKQPVTVL